MHNITAPLGTYKYFTASPQINCAYPILLCFLIPILIFIFTLISCQKP